jgi:hypothetical protein
VTTVAAATITGLDAELNKLILDGRFAAAVETFHGVTLLASATEGEVSFGEGILDVTFRGAERSPMHQVSVRRWRNGEVASERFSYSRG